MVASRSADDDNASSPTSEATPSVETLERVTEIVQEESANNRNNIPTRIASDTTGNISGSRRMS